MVWTTSLVKWVVLWISNALTKLQNKGLDPASTAKMMKNFFCKVGSMGKPELKQNRNNFH